MAVPAAAVVATELADGVAAAGPLFAASVLLLIAGVLKFVRPAAAVAALRSAGLPAPALFGRALGAGEVAIAVVAVGWGGRLPAAAVAAAYAGFAAFAALVLRRQGAMSSCGCFGVADSPLTSLHVVINVAIASVAVWAVIAPVPGIGEVLAGQPLAGVPFAALTLLGAWLVEISLTALPAVQRAAAQ